MSTTISRFGRSSNFINGYEPLTDDALFRVAPSIFAPEKHESRSERYTYIPTIDVLRGLQNEGFQPFMACQSRCRDEGKEAYTKHMLRLRHQDNFGDVAHTNEIILVNSHDGTSSYRLVAGVFRFVCMNGMVAGDVIEDVRVMHKGNIVQDVVQAAYTITEGFQKVDEDIDLMKSVSLSGIEQALLAKVSMLLKYENLDDAPFAPDRLLVPRRIEYHNEREPANSVWTTFNTIQENMTKGGIRGRSESGRRSTTREVRSINGSIDLNRALWALGHEMATLKA